MNTQKKKKPPNTVNFDQKSVNFDQRLGLYWTTIECEILKPMVKPSSKFSHFKIKIELQKYTFRTISENFIFVKNRDFFDASLGLKTGNFRRKISNILIDGSLESWKIVMIHRNDST